MLNRRRFLLLTATAFPTLKHWARSQSNEPLKQAAAGSCELTTEAIDGPYYVDDVFVRSAISDEREGIPLSLDLKIVDEDCSPIEGATVDVWHCDALGNYSGFPDADPDEFPNLRGRAKPSSELIFCRGRQIADENGSVTFQTIYPGWYTPRTVHIHLKAFLNDWEMIGTQLYFPQELNDKILGQEQPYTKRGKSPYKNQGDMVIKRSGGGTNAWPTVVQRQSASILGTHTLVVKRAH